jgi:hypothetical protein
MRRRDLSKMLLLGCAGWSAPLLRALAGDDAPAPAAGGFDATQRALVRAMAEAIIPRTDTPGALDAGVPAFIEEIVFRWYTAAERRIFVDGLAAAEATSRARFVKPFAELPPEQQELILGELETEALVAAVSSAPQLSLSPSLEEDLAPFFAKLKELVVVGYYTSEVGASVELRHERMPMRYQADIPLAEVGRAWSTSPLE